MKNIQRILSLLFIVGLITVIGTNSYAQQGKDNAGKAKGKEKKEGDPKAKQVGTEAHPNDTTRFHPDRPKGEKGDTEMKGKPHSEKGTGEKPEPGKGEPKPEMGKDKEGHAYGKNKGELEGKGFGQSRAEQARMEQHRREFELGNSVMEGDAKVMEAREKINAAKEQLEKDKKAKKISEAAYKEKKEKIDKAEQAVNNLEMEVQKAKEKRNK
jgi:colicin import membrane protein